MKKWITCFFTVCLLAVALSVTALAAGTVADVTPGEAQLTNEGDRVGVTYASAETGKEYLVLATKKEVTPATLKAEDIVYIDQKTAEGDSVTFTIIPSELVGSKTYYVYMSSNASSGVQALEQVGAYVGEGPAYELGKVDEDERITANDAALVLRASVGLVKLDERQTQAANVDGDTRITANDAAMILRASVGLVTFDK